MFQVRRDARQSMLEEEGGPKEDGEDEERKERRSIYKKGHLYRRLFTYLRSAWTGVKFNLGVLLNQVSMHDACLFFMFSLIYDLLFLSSLFVFHSFLLLKFIISNLRIVFFIKCQFCKVDRI